MNNKMETDWNKYYQQKRHILSTLTQKITFREIEKYYEKYCKIGISVLEVGGGNSCFIDSLCNKFKPSTYSVIDNNKLSLDLLKKTHPKCQSYEYNILQSIPDMEEYDFVYSVGLIEHFNKNQLSKVIENHFNFCKLNGIVLISFPTATCQYKILRRFMEFLHVWQFYDEHPLDVDDVYELLQVNGEILDIKLLRKLPLTQTMCVIRKTHSNA